MSKISHNSSRNKSWCSRYIYLLFSPPIWYNERIRHPGQPWWNFDDLSRVIWACRRIRLRHWRQMGCWVKRYIVGCQVLNVSQCGVLSTQATFDFRFLDPEDSSDWCCVLVLQLPPRFHGILSVVVLVVIHVDLNQRWMGYRINWMRMPLVCVFWFGEHQLLTDICYSLSVMESTRHATLLDLTLVSSVIPLLIFRSYGSPSSIADVTSDMLSPNPVMGDGSMNLFC
jgi:hypothetical protein